MANTSSKDELTLGDEIGSGTYANVYRAVWRNRRVAAKKFHSHISNKPELKKYIEEWRVLRELEHPNIVKYLDVILPKNWPKSRDESIIIITELLDQDLLTFIKKSKEKPKVSFRDTVSIMLDVAEGLNYLHEKSIVHRDLACKNILLTSRKRAKIADFGFAKYFPGGHTVATADPGTAASRAPEAFGRSFFRRVNYGTKADIFSFGVVMLEVIVGHLSLATAEVRTEDGKIVPEYIRRSEDLHEIDITHPLRSLIWRCLKDDPEIRPPAHELVKELMEYENNNEFQRSQGSINCRHIIYRMPAGNYDYEFKIVLVGDAAVGKTSIITRFIRPSLDFQERRPVTLNIGEFNERVQLKGKTVFLQIVDTPGQMNVTSTFPQFYRGAHGAAVVFDVASRDSLVSVGQWVSMVHEKCDRDIPIILVGNKTDCEQGVVDAETVKDQFNLFYIEVSAKTGENIEEMFSVLTEQLMQQKDVRISAASASVIVEHQLSSSSWCPGPPAKFTSKERCQRTKIKNDPDSISLISSNVDNSLTREPAGRNRKLCCF